MDTVMDILGFLKYIAIGILSLFVIGIALAIVTDMFRLLLDVIVFIIIAPFYILFHPIMFITKPMTCFKNIFMKCPCFGEEYHEAHKTPAEIAEEKQQASVGLGSFGEFSKYCEQQSFFFKETYGEDMFGNKLKK
jgi:hypothetical protein